MARWNPWNDLFDLQNQVDQLLQMTGVTPRTTTDGRAEVMNLPVDVRQSENEFVIEASVPGFRPDDVEVTFDDGVLTISGRRRSETEEKQGQYVRRERRQSAVYRQIGLPAEVRADEIRASFEHGVLRVTVPRAQKAQPKRIPVTAGDGGERQVIEHQPREESTQLPGGQG